MLPLILSALESDEDRKKLYDIYERYHAAAERVAMRILRSRPDAEDAVQNAFVQVIRHFEKFSEIPCKNQRAWIITVVRNEALMILRKRRRTVPLEDWDAIESRAESVTGYAGLVSLFAALPETYRSVLEMKYILGYSGAEIAEKLGISEGAVNTRLSRGRELLRKIMEKEGFADD